MRYDIKIRRKVFETFLKMEDTMDKKHSIFLCESCYDIWTKQFKLPVKVEKQTELL